jgi:hypothetical protein
MNYYTYAILALDIARERSAEAERNYLASQLAAAVPARTSSVRRLAARLIAAFSRGSASIVRRLDECVADDLGRELAPAE